MSSDSDSDGVEGTAAATNIKCPYLDTIDRTVLDFDMQKVCSVTLSSSHVYCCLVCGKFFEGRGRHTAAFTHSLQALHHVFMNLNDGSVWCLPDGYEVKDASLQDIQHALHPVFSPESVDSLDTSTALSSDILGITYLPGFVGMNNLRHTDGINVVIQALAHVQPLRDFFLQPSNYAAAAASSKLVNTFGELIRKIWNPAAFRGNITPLEFITEVSSASNKRFTVGKPVEAADFLTWLLNTLHTHLTADDVGAVAMSRAVKAKESMAATVSGVKRGRPVGGAGTAAVPSGRSNSGQTAAQQHKNSIITDVFQGELQVTVVSSELEAAKTKEDGDIEMSAGKRGSGAVATNRQQSIPFLCLSLDLPPAPLFRDASGANVIPQVALYTLLSKYDGETITDTLRGQYRERKQYVITKLPPYIIMTMKRFTKNQFFTDKNPTIVNFPVKNLDLRPYVALDAWQAKFGVESTSPSDEELSAMPVAELKALMRKLGSAYNADDGAMEKSELVAKCKVLISNAFGTKYDLVANVVHDSPPSSDKGSATADPLLTGSYRAHVQHVGAGQWYEVQDLHVQETQAQFIGVSESYVAVYRRNTGSVSK